MPHFKTWLEANEFCKKYNAERLVQPLDIFLLAEALYRAKQDGNIGCALYVDYNKNCQALKQRKKELGID